MGGSDARCQIGCPGAGGGKAHADFSGGSCVTVGGVGRSLLVGRQDVVDLVLVSVQLVVKVQNGAAGVAEDRVDLLLQKAFHNGCGCSDFHMITSFPSILVPLLFFWGNDEEKKQKKSGKAICN